MTREEAGRMTREEAAWLLWRVAYDKYGLDDDLTRQREAADIVVTALRERIRRSKIMANLFDNEDLSVDENGIHYKAGMVSGANGEASSVVINDGASHITICGGAGEQVKSIIKALRGLADALATLTD